MIDGINAAAATNATVNMTATKATDASNTTAALSNKTTRAHKSVRTRRSLQREMDLVKGRLKDKQELLFLSTDPVRRSALRVATQYLRTRLDRLTQQLAQIRSIPATIVPAPIEEKARQERAKITFKCEETTSNVCARTVTVQNVSTDFESLGDMDVEDYEDPEDGTSSGGDLYPSKTVDVTISGPPAG